jgi:hypothetical protein
VRAGVGVRGGRHPRNRCLLNPSGRWRSPTFTVAVRERRRVRLLYRSGLSEETERKVEPYYGAVHREGPGGWRR